MRIVPVSWLPLCRSACAAALAAGAAIAPDPLLAQDAGGGQHYPKRLFGGFSGGEMNISIFTFRDIDLDGRYDVGDRPFADIAVRMGDRAIVRSNISGFANFRASVVQRDREILGPGIYRFGVIPPPGWRITTDNQQQSIQMELLPGAPGDLVAAETADPVGLAPDLEIRGRVGSGAEGAQAAVTFSGPGSREPRSVAADQQGSFAIPVSPGAWQVETRFGEGPPLRRSVQIRDLPVVLSLRPAAESDGAAASDSQVIGFDDLITSESVAKIPNGYGNLGWHNWVVTHNRTYGGGGYVNGTLSGEYIAYNGSGHPVRVDSEEPFDFIGGNFTAAWPDAEGETLEVTAWRGDQLAYRDSFELSALGPVYLAADYRAITRLDFATEHYWQVVADDLVFGFPQQEGAPGQ